MTKYHDINSKPENDTEWVLQQIANELAEMNRLRRLKLQSQDVEFPQGSLEDKA